MLSGAPMPQASASNLDRLPFYSGCDDSWESDPWWFVLESLRAECRDLPEV